MRRPSDRIVPAIGAEDYDSQAMAGPPVGACGPRPQRASRAGTIVRMREAVMTRCAFATTVCLLAVGARAEGPNKADAGQVKMIIARISEIAQKNARAIRPIDGE